MRSAILRADRFGGPAAWLTPCATCRRANLFAPTPAARMNDAPTPDLTFLVCTFHREELLVKLLHTVLAVRGLEAIRYEIVVVDNSDAGTAQPPVEAFCAATGSQAVRYVAAHPPNIAVARNAGVAAARGRFVAMIDDDMTLDPSWYEGVRHLLTDSWVDVVCGPVEPVFDNPSLATPAATQFFHRSVPLPPGAPLLVMGSQRTRGFVPATSNSVFRRETCLSDNPCFDARYGRTGGEDVDLLCRLQRRGRRMVWAPGARTFEAVPEHRCSADYLAKRSYAGGQTFAATYVRNSSWPAWVSLKVALIAALQLLASTLLGWLRPPTTQEEHHAMLNRRAAIRGKLSWQQMFPLYEDERQPTGPAKGQP